MLHISGPPLASNSAVLHNRLHYSSSFATARRRRCSFSVCGDASDERNVENRSPNVEQVRVEVAPAVLRSLQQNGEQNTHKRDSDAGGGLIEENLRNRADPKRFLGSIVADVTDTKDISTHVSPASLNADVLKELGICSTSAEEDVKRSSEKNVPSDALTSAISSLDAYFSQLPGSSGTGGVVAPSKSRDSEVLDPDNDNTNDADSCPLKSVYWEQKPTDLFLPPVLFLDYHISRFYLCFAQNMEYHAIPAFLLFMGTEWLHSFELPNWFYVFTKNWGEVIKELSASDIKWEELIQETNNKDTIERVCQEYRELWVLDLPEDDFTTLVTVLTCSLQLQVLSKAVACGNHDADLEKRLEGVSASLKYAQFQLNRDILDCTQLWIKVLRGMPFISDGSVYVYEQALIVPGKLVGDDGGNGPSQFLEKVEERLNKDKVLCRRTALLLRSSAIGRHVYLVLAPWYWTIPMQTNIPALWGTCLVASAVLAGGYESASFVPAGAGFIWEPFAVFIAYSAILVLVVYANNQQCSYFFPYIHFGALGKWSGYPHTLQSRSSYINAILKTSCMSLATSLLLLGAGYAFERPMKYGSLQVLDLTGYVLSPSDLFPYSSVLNQLLRNFSVTVVNQDTEKVLMAVNPFSLAGILGLSYTALSVFPFCCSEGKVLLQNLTGNMELTNAVSLGLSLFVLLPLFVKDPLLGFTIVNYHHISYSVTFARDSVSEPNLIAKAIGFLFIAASVACLVPWPHM